MFRQTPLIINIYIRELKVMYTQPVVNYQAQQIPLHIQKCHEILSNPKGFDPLSFTQYLISNSMYGANDVIFPLIQNYFYCSLKNNQDTLNYITLFDHFIMMNLALPSSLTFIFCSTFEKYYLAKQRPQIDVLVSYIKKWAGFLPKNLILEIKTNISELVKGSLKTKYSRKHTETDTTVPSEDEYQPRKMMKMQRKCDEVNDSLKNNKSLLILKKLKSSYNFTCKVCGQHFQMKQTYEDHLQNHFKQRQKEYLKNRKNKCNLRIQTRTCEMNLEKWINGKLSGKVVPCKVPAPLSNEPVYCMICKYQIQTQFKQQWIYKDCICCSTLQSRAEQVLPSVYRQETTLGPNIELVHLKCFNFLKEFHPEKVE